ncbi:unnamed protein product [Pedinophyceae sp. YPF-701]|nr:unnamed protein product [Pedinophyceae sp. YPF-701]
MGASAGSSPAMSYNKAETSLGQSASLTGVAEKYAHLFASLGALIVADRWLRAQFVAQAWTFPAPLAGMFAIFTTLCVLSATSPGLADKIMDAFRPALNWIATWLPLFYLPTLVVLPTALSGIPAAALGKIGGIVLGGMVVSLLFTAQAAVFIRKFSSAQAMPVQAAKKSSPYNKWHWYGWSASAACALAASMALSGDQATAARTLYMLSMTVIGHLVGNTLVPPQLQKVFHPIITTCLVAQAGIVGLAAASGDTVTTVMQAYLTKNPNAMGAGDLLMSMLGCVILSFGFRVYEQRAIMQRHAVEIAGATVSSAAFSMMSTAVVGRLIGLDPNLTLSIVPRCVTVALALPIAQQLGAEQLTITATAVLVTGLVGANFAQTLLDRFKFKDPIVRGLATAGSSHGLGTAALAAKEPEALPYCALAYALIGIISTLLCCIPMFREVILSLAGA